MITATKTAKPVKHSPSLFEEQAGLNIVNVDVGLLVKLEHVLLSLWTGSFILDNVGVGR